MHTLYQILMVAMMVFGFGFVVFFHELGHFLAAKWVDIRVEQFAVGFGQALFAYRKGIGWKVGTTMKELRKRCEAHLDAKGPDTAKLKEEDGYTDEQINEAAAELKLGETEYRLNWLPLGGYVKMVGQDDLKANAGMDDPRAYNRKGIGQRMIVVSAGVIMNIILAAVGFMVVFMLGLTAPAPVVGSVVGGSPADKAGIPAGATILTIDGARQHDFIKVGLATALAHEGSTVVIEYTRPGETEVRRAFVKPERMEPDSKSFLSLGIGPDQLLEGKDPKDVTPEDFKQIQDPATFLPQRWLIKPGDTIIAVNGQPVRPDQHYVLEEALQKSGGIPVPITVRDQSGKIRDDAPAVTPYFEHPFSSTRDLNFAGMQPRPMVEQVPATTSVKNKMLPGDVIVAVRSSDLFNYPDVPTLKKVANKAYEGGGKLTVYVLRGGKLTTVDGIEPKTKTGDDLHGMGVQLGSDATPVISTVLKDSAADKAGIKDGMRINRIDDVAVANWFQVRDVLAARPAGKPHKIEASQPEAANLDAFESEGRVFTLTLNDSELQELKNIRAANELLLRDHTIVRHTANPLEAASWGVTETRDLVLQFYVTLKRMFQRSISPSNMMGPLGIVTSGAHFAFMGFARLFWFLAMISANLAVVNFLPIPIVDGGLFTFLVLEKIQGKPLSPKVQAVFQIVGFALIISVFLLVTYQDLRRTIGF